jgi:hypothetical protein
MSTRRLWSFDQFRPGRSLLRPTCVSAAGGSGEGLSFVSMQSRGCSITDNVKIFSLQSCKPLFCPGVCHYAASSTVLDNLDGSVLQAFVSFVQKCTVISEISPKGTDYATSEAYSPASFGIEESLQENAFRLTENVRGLCKKICDVFFRLKWS